MKYRTLEKLNELSICLILSISTLFVYFWNYMSSDNLIYAIGQINSFDSDIFQNNVFFYGMEYSPRRYMDYIYALVMKIFDLNWADTCLVFCYFGVIIAACAIVKIVFKCIDNYKYLFTLLLSIFVCLGVNVGIGGFKLYGFNDIGLGNGIAFALLAVSEIIGENKNWNRCCLWLTIAAIMHIHEGIWAGAILFLMWVIDRVYHKAKIPFFGWVYLFVILMICIPSIFTDTVNTLSNREFFDIYVKYRHPHHLMPSAWGKRNILRFFILMVLPFVIQIVKKIKAASGNLNLKNVLFDEETVKYFCLTFFWIIALIVMYIFTEIYPSSAIITLFISKAFKYISFFGIIVYIEFLSKDLMDKEKYVDLIVFTIFIIAAINLSLTMLLVLTLLLIIAYYYLNRASKVMCYILIILYSFSSVSEFSKTMNIIFIGIGIAIALYNCAGSSKRSALVKNIIIIFSCAFVFLSGTFGKVWSIENGYFRINNGQKYIINATGTEIYDIALRFREISDVSDTFMTYDCIDDKGGWIQLISLRNVWVSNKIVPSSKSAIQEWYRRIELNSNLDKEGIDVEDLMLDNDIKYIFVEQDNWDKFENNTNYKTVIESENYKMYELV